MNFLRWAESALDSVDAQATDKVNDIRDHIQQGVPVSASKLFSLVDKRPAAAEREEASSSSSSINSSKDPPPSEQRQSHDDDASASITPVSSASASPVPSSSVSPSPIVSSVRSSPLRAPRTLANGSGTTPSPAPPGLSSAVPKHNKEPSAKSVSARDEELLSMLNSHTPMVMGTPVRSPSPSPGSSRETSDSPAPPGASGSSSAMQRTSSGQLLTSLLNRVSPGNSPATSMRKLSSAARGAMCALVDASASAAASVSAATSAEATVPAAAGAHSSTGVEETDVGLLQAELAECRQERDSLKSVWHESRASLAKMKSLLLAKEEQWKARSAAAEEAAKAALDAQAKAHAQALEEARKTTLGSEQEVGSHIALLARTKLEHVRQVTQLEDRIAQLEKETIPELQSKLAAAETELAAAQDRLESQAALHLQQLSDLQAAQSARERTFESELHAHHSSLSSFNHRAQSLEVDNEEYVAAIASLQRQLEAATLARDKLQSEERMRNARAELDAEMVANLKRQLEQATKGAAAAAQAAKLRLEAAQTRIDELTAEWQDAQDQCADLQQRIADLESAPASSDGSLLSPPLSSPMTGWGGPATAAHVEELQDRVRSMAESLLQRTSLAERLTSEKTSLKLQLEQESLRVSNLEQQLRTWKAKALDGGARSSHDADDDDADLEGGVSVGARRAASGRMGVAGGKGGRIGASSSYGAEGARITGLPSTHVVAQAVGLVDSAGMQVAIMLRRYPALRVSFGIYVLLIHLWAAFVFTHFMHEFGHETHATPTDVPTVPGMASRP